MLTSALKIAGITLIAVLIVVACHFCLFLDTLTQTTAQLPVTIDGAIAREGTLTRTAASKQITEVSTKLDHQVTSLRTDLFARVDTIEKDSFQQIDQVRIDANRQIAETRTAAVNEIAKVSTPAGNTLTEMQAMIPPAKNILANSSETSDLLLDCQFNPDCLANRVIPALKSAEKMANAGERTMNAIADATPETAKAVQSTSQDLAKIVKKFSQPVSWVKNAAITAATIIGKFLGL